MLWFVRRSHLSTNMFRFAVFLFLAVSSPTLGECKVGVTKFGLTSGGLATELAQLGIYSATKRAILVRNRADDWFRVWCASKDDSTGEIRLNGGESMGFAFKPRFMGGSTTFWCTLDYKGFWARWDVFGHNAFNYESNKNDRAYEYEVRNDGVYYKGQKIRGLANGENRYQLWENFDSNKNPYGASLTGYVDNGKCNNLPGWMEWKTSEVTLCDGSCVVLHSDLHCRGQTSRLQAGGGCYNFWLSYFNDKTRSVKGC